MRKGSSNGLRFVLLMSGWSGEATLVRLISAGGGVRVVGQVLADPVRDPARHIRTALSAASAEGDRSAGVLVHPDHLWLRNRVDPDEFVVSLLADGIVVLSLHRESHVDRGLSRAMSGSRAEVIGVGPYAVDAGEVVVYAKDNEFAAAWFDTVALEDDLRLVFERDLVTDTDRSRTAALLQERLGLPRREPPPERHPVVHEALWRRVADSNRLARQLDELLGAEDA